jgi:hypothetical protein
VVIGQEPPLTVVIFVAVIPLLVEEHNGTTLVLVQMKLGAHWVELLPAVTVQGSTQSLKVVDLVQEIVVIEVLVDLVMSHPVFVLQLGFEGQCVVLSPSVKVHGIKH